MGLLKESQRRAANDKGFRDALVIGRPDPMNKPDWEQVAYDKGFDDGKRAVARIVAEARK